jgi:hypothetical protein
MVVPFPTASELPSPFASVQTWSAPPRNHDWLAACITLG